MNRETLLEHLEQAERHLAAGERHLERQRGVIEQLRRDCHHQRSIDQAEKPLHTLEDVRRTKLALVARIRGELTTTN